MKNKNTSKLLWFYEQSATTAVEYALIAAGIAVAIAVIVLIIGTDLAGKYRVVGENLK